MGQVHWPLPETMCGAESVEHFRSQFEPEQLNEQDPVQPTWHVAPDVHETLPLFPTLTVQVEASQLILPLAPVFSVQELLPLQSALHDPAQSPTHWLPLAQLSEQLPPIESHPVPALPVQVQEEPGEQTQLEPLQLQSAPGQAEVNALLEQPRVNVVTKSR